MTLEFLTRPLANTMNIVKRLSNAGASEAALLRLEATIGCALPADYRQFLKETNGGRPEPAGFRFEAPEGQEDASIRYFLTLDEQEANYSILEFLDQYEDRIPSKMLPIASDSFGNLVLLDLGAKSYGAVYFWDHEKESMDEPTWDNISTVAESFSAFVEILE